MPLDPDVGADFGFVEDLPLTRDAIAFAQERHAAQRRVANGAPFVLHPLEVSKVRELRILIATGLDQDAAAVKLERYRKSLDMLEHTTPKSLVIELLRFEIEALETLPPERG